MLNYEYTDYAGKMITSLLYKNAYIKAKIQFITVCDKFAL